MAEIKKKIIFTTEFFLLCAIGIFPPVNQSGVIPYSEHLRGGPADILELSLERQDPSALWRYLRRGLNYLEASGQDYPPDLAHPQGAAYGALGLSRIAAEDVLSHNNSLGRVGIQDVFKDKRLYEYVAACYADLLLSHYLGLNYQKMPPEEVFCVLQRAWYLGPKGYKKGLPLLACREKRAKEFIESARRERE